MCHRAGTPVRSVFGTSVPRLRIPSERRKGGHVHRDCREASSCRAKGNIESRSAVCPRPGTNRRTRDAPAPSTQEHAGDRLRSLRTLEERPQASIASHPGGETKKAYCRTCTARRTRVPPNPPCAHVGSSLGRRRSINRNGPSRGGTVQRDRQAVEALAHCHSDGMNRNQRRDDQQEACQRRESVPVGRNEQRDSSSQHYGAEDQCQQHLLIQARGLCTLTFELADAFCGWPVENAGARPALQCVLKGLKHHATSVILRIA